MKPATLMIWFVLTTSLYGCGSGGGGNSPSGNSNSSIDFVGDVSASSQLCAELSGYEAIYWDFIHGVLRADLPSTAFTIPFNVQGSYTNSRHPILGFLVPVGWSVFDAVDQSGYAFSGTEVGADLIRNDNQAVWRYMQTAQISGNFTSASILNAEVNTALSFLGNPTQISEHCEINFQRAGILGPESFASKVVRTDNFTIMAQIRVIIVEGTASYYTGHLTVARTSENPQLIHDIFVPMITQLYGGGSDPAACEDGEDNDGDNQIDFGQDPQCDNPSDDNEAA